MSPNHSTANILRIFVIVCVFSFGFSGCGSSGGGGGSNIPRADVCGDFQGMATPDEIAQTPRENAEAELLVLEATGAFIAPQEVYDRVISDLAAIRTNYLAVANIKAMPKWSPNSLVIGFDSEGIPAVREKTYTGWDCPNGLYGMTQIDDGMLSFIGAVVLSFKGRFNMPALASEYTSLPNVLYAEPNYFVGDGNDICLSVDDQTYSYVFDAGFGDCPSGCISHVFHVFTTDYSGHITELGTWERIYGNSPPSWLENLSECTKWL